MNSFLNFLTLAGEMTSYGAPGGMDAHSAAADRAKDCSAGEPVSFLPWLQNHSPRGPFVSVLDFLSLSVPASRPPPLPPFPPPPTFSQQTFFPSFINFAACFHHSVWQCSHIRQHLRLPCHFSETVFKSPYWLLSPLPSSHPHLTPGCSFT